MTNPRTPDGTATRRRLLGVGAAGAAIGLAAAPLPAHAAPSRTRARFRLTQDYGIPPEAFGIVPWDTTVFQTGSDVTLQPGGKLLVNTAGIYELVFSSDWDAKSNNDVDLRKIGIRLQALGQPDEPMEDHDRLGFMNMPGSDPPAMARFQGAWAPPALPLNGVAHIDVGVAPTGVVLPGDTAQASLTSISQSRLPDDALTALMVQAKVIAPDTVRVTLYNPSIAGGIQVAAGTLRVVAMSSTRTRGSNGDSWMVMHTASIALAAGDRVYGLIQHKVPGTLLQATHSSYLQIDRVA
ncbi:MAG TPA: hypothetical protein VGQ91_18065 [Ideonella sp.]|jgi:hypothetical protein|nr:hypothetical protein [Ideonella sp.]